MLVRRLRQPGELETIRFFYPKKAAEIEALQAEARAAGVHAVWGTRPPRGTTVKTAPVGPLCQQCEFWPGDTAASQSFPTSGTETQPTTESDPTHA